MSDYYLQRGILRTPVAFFLLLALISTLQLSHTVSALSPALSATVPVRGQIQPNDKLVDLVQLGPHTRAVLRRIPERPDSSSSPASPDAADAPPSSSSASSSPADESDEQQKRWTYTTLVRRDGSFTFPAVQAGAYELNVENRWRGFPSYRVDVDPSLAHSQQGQAQSAAAAAAEKAQEVKEASAEADGVVLSQASAAAAPTGQQQAPAVAPDFRASHRGPVKVRVHTPGTPLSSTLTHSPVLPAPFILHATIAYDFFTEPESFNIQALLSNPMMLIAIAGGVMVLIMPRIMANMDPEDLAELTASQDQLAAKMGALQRGDVGGLFSGSSPGAPAGAAAGPGGGGAVSRGVSTGKSGGGGKKRR